MAFCGEFLQGTGYYRPVGSAGVEEFAEQPGHTVPGQRPQGDVATVRQPMQIGLELRITRHKVTGLSQYDDGPGGSQPAGQGEQAAQRRLVGVLHIIDRDQHRGAPPQLLQTGVHLAQHLEFMLVRVVRVDVGGDPGKQLLDDAQW
ncbi:hypothetical protein ACZ90_64775 [Streptomyces albus subsp. albus]|nr:hypothetical protein ACZ90_64775 [Streptomyces albus subsp. albus]